MTTTISEETTLDRRAINALRLADDVYANFYEGAHTLRAVKRPTSEQRDANPFADDVTVTISCDGSIANYDKSGPVEECFASLRHCTGVWQIVRPGDRLRLRWSRGGHSSENTRAVGYVGDELTIEVIRKSDTLGRKPLQFLANVYVGPNNLARLCR